MRNNDTGLRCQSDFQTNAGSNEGGMTTELRTKTISVENSDTMCETLGNEVKTSEISGTKEEIQQDIVERDSIKKETLLKEVKRTCNEGELMVVYILVSPFLVILGSQNSASWDKWFSSWRGQSTLLWEKQDNREKTYDFLVDFRLETKQDDKEKDICLSEIQEKVPGCTECQIKRRDPTPEELTMCLHAAVYKVKSALILSLSLVFHGTITNSPPKLLYFIDNIGYHV